MKKKVLAILLSAAMVISMAACGSGGNDREEASAGDNGNDRSTAGQPAGDN